MKITNELIMDIVSIVEKKLKQKQNEDIAEAKCKAEEPPLFRTKTQYPLKGWDFYVPQISYYANFDELCLYSPYSIFEVDDDHKRRRKPIGTRIFMMIETETWEKIKREAPRTTLGIESRYIKKIMDENEKLKEENDKLHELILTLAKEEN